jgi:hypothetical protein
MIGEVTPLLPSNQSHGSRLYSASQLSVNVSSSKTIPPTSVGATPLLPSNRSHGSQLHSASQLSVDVSVSRTAEVLSCRRSPPTTATSNLSATPKVKLLADGTKAYQRIRVSKEEK